MKKKFSVTLSVGGSLILVVFIILAITTFAVLALSSAVSDRDLSRKTLEYTKLYYEAENKAEEKLGKIHEAICLGARSPDMESYLNGRLNGCEITREDGSLLITFQTEITKDNEIFVKLKVLDGSSEYKIINWQAVNNAPWESDDSLNLWIEEE